MRHKIFIFLIFCLFCNFAVIAANLLKDGSFEQGNNLLDTQPYWSGTVTHLSDKSLAHTGSGVLRLESAPARNTVFGRLLLRGRQTNASGRIYSFSLWARGSGALHLGAIHYITPPEGKPPYEYDWQNPGTQLNDEWQQVTFKADLSRKFVNALAFVVELRGEGEVYIDDISLETITEPGAQMEAPAKYAMITAGKDATVTFQTNPQTTAMVYVSKGKNPAVYREMQSDAQGKVTVPAELLEADQPGSCQVTAAAGGAVATMKISVIDKEAAAQSLALAQNVKLTKPLRILYLGDSLTDFDRGNNYCDKVDYWLNQAYPGLASFRNAGVGGDYIVRMEDRIYGRKAHRLEMYDGLWDEKYDLILIFLGHNDTKTTAASDFQVPVVPPAKQEESYRKVLELIRQKSQAPIVLVSGAAMIEEICRRNHQRAAQTKPNASLFGMPKHVETFNEVLQKLSRELKTEYLDVYTKTKNHPDRETLFYPTDGVHLSEAGHVLVADVILKEMAKWQR